jgi:hypothetical protein
MCSAAPRDAAWLLGRRSVVVVPSCRGPVYSSERGGSGCSLLSRARLSIPGRRLACMAHAPQGNPGLTLTTIFAPPCCPPTPSPTIRRWRDDEAAAARRPKAICHAGGNVGVLSCWGLATAVFAYLFLQHLPREILVLLSEDDPVGMRAIADKANRLIALHIPQCRDACAAIAGKDDQDLDLVAGTLGAKHKKVRIPVPKRPQQPQQAGSGQQGGPHHRVQDQTYSLKTSMCYYHAKFSKQACYCKEGRLWPESYSRMLGVISAVRPSHLFHITDYASNCRFLVDTGVDTGSAFSIMP